MSGRPSAYLLAGAAAVIAAVPVQAQARPMAMGSLVPCAVPMTWTVARIAPRFDLSEDQALDAAREAGTLWEQAVGAGLFEFDVRDGSPVFFEFDQRQAALEEGRERERALESERMAIESRRTELDEAAREYDSKRRQYEDDATEHGWAVRAYNDDMARLARQDDVSRSERAEIERRAQDLDRNARDLQNRARDLNRLSDALSDDVDVLNEWIEAFRSRQAAHAGAYPQAPTEAGNYDETLYWRGTETDSITRRIRVFQFTDHDMLVRVLAHELGHALGLGHAPGDGALMSAIMPADTASVPSGGITPVDARMLAARCPDLGR